MTSNRTIELGPSIGWISQTGRADPSEAIRNQSLLLARWLGAEVPELAESLRTGRARDLGSALALQPATTQKQLHAQWGHHLSEAISLVRRGNPRSFYGSLYHFGGKLESSHPQVAAAIYGSLQALESVPTRWSEAAAHRMKVLNGGGSFAECFPFYVERFQDTVMSPELFIGMGGANIGMGLGRL